MASDNYSFKPMFIFGTLILLNVINLHGQSSLQDFLATVASTKIQIKVDGSKSVYSFKNFRTGEICFRGNNCFKNEQIRVELLNNVFEFRLSDGTVLYAPGNFVNKYSFYETESLSRVDYVTEIISGGLPISNYELINRTEKLNLLREVYAEIPNSQKDAGYLPGVAGDGNVIIKKYRFYAIADNEIYLIKRSISAIAEEINCDKKVLKRFVKENKLNVKQNKELYQIIEYALAKRN